MKICLAVSDFCPKVGGIATFNTHLAEALAAHPAIEEVRVIALQSGEHGESVASKLLVRRMPLGNLIETFLALWRELDMVRDFDVFHSPNVFPVGFFTLLIVRYRLRKPFVATFFGTDVLAREGRAATKWAKGFVLKHASAAVAFSRSTRALAAARYRLPLDRFRVIYCPLPPHPSMSPEPSVRTRYGFSADNIVVLTVCTLVKRKGVDDLIRAVARVDDPRVKLLIAGDGPERRALETLVRELGLESRVRFAGRVFGADALYHEADIFALTSYYMKEAGDVEGLGIVFLEAAQHGLPVVGTKSGGIPEALIENETGFLAPERDVGVIARHLSTLARNPELRRAMGEKGRVFVAERFGTSSVLEEYLALYREVSQP